MSASQDFNCVLCKELFDTKEDLQTHFRKHGDPKFNQNANSSKGRPREGSTQGSGDKAEEGQTEMVTCDVCTEVFPTISKAITHKHKFHPDHDAKYFCPWCGKLFTMKHLYNKHIENNHKDIEPIEGSEFHCDYCEVDFFAPSAMVYHNKFFHRQDTELAAIGHSKKIKMFNQEPLQAYYCPFCGEEYFNKVNLHKHMGDDHSDENQSPDDVLRCPLCEAVFYHLDAYELHLTFHSSDDMFGNETSSPHDITEFSLETVPPIMEKVENEIEDGASNPIGIEELLQQAMNDSNDNDNSNSESILGKKKKRKKHKKSKKTITLDEFLNMNKDVFGEGIGNVQGIEEVPTQVVAKQLKARKPQNITAAKVTTSAEIAKLKSQGILVKRKSSNTVQLQGVKVLNKMRPANLQNIKANTVNRVGQTNPTVNSTNDVLAKLNNSQIKIVKKSSLDPILSEKSGDFSNESDNSPSAGAKLKSPEPNESVHSTEKTEKNDMTQEDENNKEAINEEEMSPHNAEYKDFKKPSEKISQIEVGKTNSQEFENNITSSKPPSASGDQNPAKKEEPKSDTSNAISALKNLSQHITIKSLSSPSNENTQSKSYVDQHKESKLMHSDSECNVDEKKIIKNYEVDEPQDEPHDQPIAKPLNALKQLSHLTVKSVNQTSSVAAAENKNLQEPDEKLHGDEFDIEACIQTSAIPKQNKAAKNEEKRATQQAPSTSMGALKNMSKHITIKSLNQSTKNADIEETYFETDDNDHNMDDGESLTSNSQNGENISETTHQNIKLPSTITMKSFKSPTIKTQSPIKTPSPENDVDNLKEDREENETSKAQSYENILKQLPNITAKPLNAPKITSNVRSSNTNVNVQKGNLVHKTPNIDRVAKEEMEIFNIDDSDDEVTDNNHISQKVENVNNPNTNKIKVPQNAAMSQLNTLRNINKNITVKSLGQQKNMINDSSISGDNNCDGMVREYHSDFSDEEMQNAQSSSTKNTLLSDKLKNLSKHLTVKSNSPKMCINSPNVSIKKAGNLSNFMEDEDPETASSVKITEIHDDHGSEDGTADYNNSKKVIVQTPDSDSDNAEGPNEHDDDDDSDEPLINQASKLTQNAIRKQACISKLRNSVMKSLNDANFDDDDDENDSELHDQAPVVPNFGKEMTVKPLKQVRPNAGVGQTEGKSVRQQLVAQSSKQQATSDQTINKKVTVQRFQSETVIEEITTTVTKTIRTVNQSVKQEVRNTNQSTPMIRPQRVQNMRPFQQIKHSHITPVRSAVPPLRPNFRNSSPGIRPTVGTVVRTPNQSAPVRANAATSNQIVPFRPPAATSNQLVPVRHGLTLPGKAPRMPVQRTQTSTTTRQTPPVGRPLKISPQAMITNKKPVTEESTGPFSCFKKPKESAIPSFDDDVDDEDAEFASTSQLSRSNFSSITKTVKGNSVVKSSQMSSEVSSSMQQVNKLSGMSGLRVVKTSQAKQMTQFEEKCEVNPSKRSALEAIERLQKQGLLVKKPRVEEDLSDHSKCVEDDYDDDT